MIRKGLLRKGVSTSIATIREKREKLQNQHRRYTRKGKQIPKYYQPCHVHFDHACPSTLAGTEFEVYDRAELEDCQDSDEVLNAAHFDSSVVKYSAGKLHYTQIVKWSKINALLMSVIFYLSLSLIVSNFKLLSVASWGTKCALELVRILIDNEGDYHKPIHRPRFWDGVSQLMKMKQLYYTAQQCEAKAAVLQAAYNL